MQPNKEITPAINSVHDPKKYKEGALAGYEGNIYKLVNGKWELDSQQ